MAAVNNIKTYEPFADLVRRSPVFDLADLFELPRTRFAYPAMRGEPRYIEAFPSTMTTTSQKAGM